MLSDSGSILSRPTLFARAGFSSVTLLTMGIGVAPDSTFAGRLSALCPAWRILNPSWVGYSSADYLNITRALLSTESPARSTVSSIRRVTIFWTLNDVYSHCDVGVPPGQVLRANGFPILNWLRQHYRTYAWLKQMFFDRPKAYFEFDSQFYRRDDPRFVAALHDVSAIRDVCTKRNVELQIVLLPYEYQLRPIDSGAHLPEQLLSQMLDSLHVQWCDLTPSLRKLPGNPQSLYLYGDGIHFSKRGHREISRDVQEALGSPCN